MSEPILGYELIIDTGNHPPICVKQPHYGIHKSFIMDKHIFLFIQKLWIIQDRSSPKAATISLAPKPHQEHIFSIDDYARHFCINYFALNLVTRPAQFPILNCKDTVFTVLATLVYSICLIHTQGIISLNTMTPYL